MFIAPAGFPLLSQEQTNPENYPSLYSSKKIIEEGRGPSNFLEGARWEIEITASVMTPRGGKRSRGLNWLELVFTSRFPGFNEVMGFWMMWKLEEKELRKTTVWAGENNQYTLGERLWNVNCITALVRGVQFIESELSIGENWINKAIMGFWWTFCN